MDKGELTGKIAVITGAAHGIGKATAWKLAARGARLALNDLPQGPELPALVVALKAAGSEAQAFPADVSQGEAVKTMMRDIARQYGKIDILINNVGIHRDGFTVRMKDEDWDRVMDTNLRGTFLCTRAALRYMMELPWGRIINISSVAGIIGNAERANYAASKGAIIAFTKSLAREVGSRNITANAIAPGLILTEPTALLPQSEKDIIMSRLAIRRFGEPEDIADTVVFLAGPYSGYITAQVIRVDGGFI
jgi:3-oxoacyl-[acyl-carrier protein] reductase